MKLTSKTILATFITAAGLLAAPAAPAETFHIDINTSAISSLPSELPFSLDLALVSGGTFTNTLTFSNFSLVSGATVDAPLTLGNASGDLNSSVTLFSGTNFINDLNQPFSDGTTEISFDMTTTTVTGGTPDVFTVSILDSNGTPLNTADPLGSLASFEIHTNTASDPILISTFDSQAPSPTGVSATVSVVSVPEPAAAAFLLGGFGMLLGLRRRRLA